MRRVRRAISFGRGLTLRQIARRGWLVLSKRVAGRLRPVIRPGALAAVAHPPRALFPARTGLVRRAGGRWSFRFVGREVAMAEDAIDWRAPGTKRGDQLWRMNLHYMEYLEELGDEDVAELMASWIRTNPPYAAGATDDSWNAYALSLRTVVWLQQIAERGDRLDSRVVGEAEASVSNQLCYLERYLETDLGGNHLIKNIKALAWGSAYFQGAAASRWRERAIRHLARELPRQILPDGMHFELSPSYHAQVFADLLEIRHALGGDPLSGTLDSALQKAAQVVADLQHPDGLVPQFGDSGLCMAYSPTACLTAYAQLFGSAPSRRAVVSLAASGYYGCRRADNFVIVDAGRIAPYRLPAHGHGDIFSFEWSVGGNRIVVDQGVFEYVAGERRRRSRSSASHNTLSIEEMDQAEFFGAFRCGRQARVLIEEFEASADGFLLQASHDGFKRQGGPIHRRRFAASPRHIHLHDTLEAPGPHRVRICLLLHPETAVERLGANRVQLRHGAVGARVSASAAIAVEAAVWWPDMGVEYPTSRIVVTLPPDSREAWMELSAD